MSLLLGQLMRNFATASGHEAELCRCRLLVLCEEPSSANNVRVIVLGYYSIISSKPPFCTTGLVFVFSWGCCHRLWYVWTCFVSHVHWQLPDLPRNQFLSNVSLRLFHPDRNVNSLGQLWQRCETHYNIFWAYICSFNPRMRRILFHAHCENNFCMTCSEWLLSIYKLPLWRSGLPYLDTFVLITN